MMNGGGRRKVETMVKLSDVTGGRVSGGVGAVGCGGRQL
jgi:hypothetical protein